MLLMQLFLHNTAVSLRAIVQTNVHNLFVINNTVLRGVGVWPTTVLVVVVGQHRILSTYTELTNARTSTAAATELTHTHSLFIFGARNNV